MNERGPDFGGIYREEWPQWRPMVELALRSGTGTHSIADVEAAIERNEMALMTGDSAILVLEMPSFPQFRALRILAACGNLMELKNFAPRIQRVADAFGCTRVIVDGRMGWERTLKPFGFTKGHVVLCMGPDVHGLNGRARTGGSDVQRCK
jgi:hypothetical protein